MATKINPSDLPEWLPLDQFAKLVGCSYAMAQHRLKAGLLAGDHKRHGGHVMVSREMLRYASNFEVLTGTSDRTKWGDGWAGFRTGRKQRAKQANWSNPLLKNDSPYSTGLLRDSLKQRDKELQAESDALRRDLGMPPAQRKNRPL